jgi:hypothetical protein
MRRPPTVVLVVAGFAAVAFTLRLEGVLGQSLWLDEYVTGRVVDNDFKDVLRHTAGAESTPGLFYILEWAVTQVLGVGSRTLRLLPLAAGVATVPVAFMLGRRLRDDACGLILAALVAIHPLAVWYGVEGRNYGLFLLLSLVTLYCFVRLLQEPDPRWVAFWTLSAATMTLCHYFGAFVVGAQLIWLLGARPGARRELALGAAALAVVAAAAAPLWAIQDNGRAAWIGDLALDGRLSSWVHQAALGMSTPDIPLAGFVWFGAGAAIASALYFAVRGARHQSETIALAACLLLAVGLSLVFGRDYLLGRNMIGVWPFAAALVAVGLASLPRWLAVIPALLIAVPAAIATGAVITKPELQRPDFKGLAQALGPRKEGQVIVLSGFSPALTLGYYLNTDQQPPHVGVPATEIVAVGAAEFERGRSSCESGALCNLGTARPLDPPLPGDLAGVELVERRRAGYWQIAVYRSARPVNITEDASVRFFDSPVFPARFVPGARISNEQ